MEKSRKINLELLYFLDREKLVRKMLTSDRGLPFSKLKISFKEPKDDTKLSNFNELIPYIIKTNKFPKEWYETTKKLFFPYLEEQTSILEFNKKELNLILKLEDIIETEEIEISPEEIIKKKSESSPEPYIIKRSHGEDGRIIIDLDNGVIEYDALM